MRLSVDQHGPFVTGVPTDLERMITYWFNGQPRRAPDGQPAYAIPVNKVLALRAYYRPRSYADGSRRPGPLMVDPLFQRWHRHHWSAEQIAPRIAPHVHSHPANEPTAVGYQVPIIAEAIAKQALGIVVDAGGGKTIIAFEIARLVGPMLVICSRLIYEDAWLDDWATRYQNGPLKLHMVAAMAKQSPAERRAQFRRPADVYVVSPDLVGGAILDDIRDLPLAGVIIDESGDQIRNADRQLTQVAHEQSRRTDYHYTLTADPTPTDPEEIWPQAEFLESGRLGTRAEFRKELREAVKESATGEMNSAQRAVIMRKCADLFRVVPTSSFAPSLPKPEFIPIPVQLGPIESQRYNEMFKDRKLRHNDVEIKASGGLDRTQKLREITSGFAYGPKGSEPVYFGEGTKLRHLLHILLREVPNEQVIVWVNYDEEFTLIGSALDRYRVTTAMVRGTDRDSRLAREEFKRFRVTQAVGRFRRGDTVYIDLWGVGQDRHPACRVRSIDKRRRGVVPAKYLQPVRRVMIGHPKTAAHGLRFPQCRDMVFFSLDYRAYRYRALKRIWRPPQTRVPRFRFLIAGGTIDEDIWSIWQSREDWRVAFQRTMERPPLPVVATAQTRGR